MAVSVPEDGLFPQCLASLEADTVYCTGHKVSHPAHQSRLSIFSERKRERVCTTRQHRLSLFTFWSALETVD